MTDAFITALEEDTSDVLSITDFPGWNWTTTDNKQRQLTHQEDRMTLQLSYLIAEQRQAELVSRAERARLAGEERLARSASAPRWDPAQFGGRIPFVCAGDAARVPMSATYPTPGCIGPNDLDDEVEEMYDRGVAPEKPRPVAPHASALAEAAGYPPLCAHGMNSLTDKAYDLALARLRRR
jgi:hypothetical protein